MLKMEDYVNIRKEFGDFVKITHEGEFGTNTMIVDFRSNKNKFKSITTTMMKEVEAPLIDKMDLDSNYVGNAYLVFKKEVNEDIKVKMTFQSSSKDAFLAGMELRKAI